MFELIVDCSSMGTINPVVNNVQQVRMPWIM